jgi:hypothetical protein
MESLKGTSDDFYRVIELTDAEKEAAYLEGQKKKFFKEKHRSYWVEQEAKKVGQTLDKEVGKL